MNEDQKVVEEAETFVKTYPIENGVLKGGDLSTSYVRNILGRVNIVKNNRNNELQNWSDGLEELKIYLVYESGRKKDPKGFARNLISRLDTVRKDNSKLDDFCQFTEACVAFFKFYGLKEKEGDKDSNKQHNGSKNKNNQPRQTNSNNNRNKGFQSAYTNPSNRRY